MPPGSKVEEPDYRSSPIVYYREPRRNVYRSLSWLLLILFLPTTVWLLVQQRRILDQLHNVHPNQAQRLMSDVPKRLVLFEQDERFVKTNPHSESSPWKTLFPPDGGFVDINNARGWGLSGGFEDENGTWTESETYCLSVFHQLHCLASIKASLSKLHTLDKTNYEEGDEGREAEMTDPDHLDHCIDLLRQAIMCAGDTTFEQAFTVGEDVGTDGWGANHECRDWSAVMHFALSHEA